MAAPAGNSPFEPPLVPVVPAIPFNDMDKTEQALPQPPPPSPKAREIDSLTMGTLHPPTATATAQSAFLEESRVKIGAPTPKDEYVLNPALQAVSSGDKDDWDPYIKAQMSSSEEPSQDLPRPINVTHVVVLIPQTDADKRWAKLKPVLYTLVAAGALAVLAMVLQNSSISGVSQAVVSSSTPLHAFTILTGIPVVGPLAIVLGGLSGAFLIAVKFQEVFGTTFTPLRDAIEDLREDQAKAKQQEESEAALLTQESEPLQNRYDDAIDKMEALHAAIFAWDERVKELHARASKDPTQVITAKEVQELNSLQQQVNTAAAEYQTIVDDPHGVLSDGKYADLKQAVSNKVLSINNAIAILVSLGQETEEI